MKKTTMLVLFSLLTISATAAPRTKAAMQAAAAQAINEHRAGLKMAPRIGTAKELATTDEYSIIGYENGGFAVVSADDLVPEILGVSNKKYSEGKNENFNWWLRTIQKSIQYAVANNIPMSTTKPGDIGYPTQVGPLMTTEWDQLAPYNNYCPISTGGDRCYTGCVATAMAQVLNYQKTPVQGIGTRTIYYPFNSTSSNRTAVTAEFGEHIYDWNSMRDTYVAGNYSSAEADAVATLMRDCGVAANMQYGGYQEGGSGAYGADAAAGLRTYFGIETAEFLERDNYSEAEWMDLVYEAISQVGPVYYDGADLSPWVYSGHAFVLHGYRADGKVYVNWGWSGDDDGYYDIAQLNPPGYHFNAEQGMIVGIQGDGTTLELVDMEVELTTAGTLASKLGDTDPLSVARLKVKGRINSSDLKLIREMAGVDQTGKATKGHLGRLYLKEAKIVTGGEPYLVENGQSYTTAADELPYKAFYGARALRKIELPDVKEYGHGALSATNIDSLGWADHAINELQKFVIEDNIVYDADDPTIIIGSLPTLDGNQTVREGTTILRPYAFASANMGTLTLPNSLVSLEQNALERCTQLREIKIFAKTVPETGTNVFTGIDQSDCKLLVPSGTKDEYKRAQGWKDFTTIKEFGTTIKARNATRQYGEKNPTFGYLLQGDYVAGRAELTCEADEKSPVGTYPIVPSAGTITAQGVEFVEGVLEITPAPLTDVSVEAVTRMQFEENPEWVFTATGLKNDETVADAFTTLPTVTTDATAESPEGEYVLIISGGVAPNYTIKSYKESKLVVDGVYVDGILNISEARRREGAGARDMLNLAGQRVNDGYKGIVIKSGKKIIVK